MQNAAFAPTAASSPKRRNEMMVQGKQRIIWSPHRFNCQDRRVGHLFIAAKEFVQILDMPERVIDASLEAYKLPEDEDRGLNDRVKTSMSIVDELVYQWGQRGLIHLASLDEVPHASIVAIERVVMPQKENARLIDWLDHLTGFDVSKVEWPDDAYMLRQASVKTVNEILEALKLAMELDMMQIESWRSEHAARLRGEPGIQAYTPEMKRIAWEWGEELKEGQEISFTQQLPQVSSAESPALAQAMATIAQSQQQITAMLAQQGEVIQGMLSGTIALPAAQPEFDPNELMDVPAPPDEAFTERPARNTKPASVAPPTPRNKRVHA